MSDTRGSRMVWVAIAAGLAFVLVAVIFADRFGTDPGISSSPLIGKAAPDSQIALMDGTGEVSLGDFAGDIVVVNYWSSWCLNCRVEHDALTRAAGDYAEIDVTFLAVNYQDNPTDAEAFLDELGRSDVTVYTVDEDSRTAFEWGIIGLPETFFVNREGIVVGKISGPTSYELLSRTIDQIILGQTIGDIETGEVENR